MLVHRPRLKTQGAVVTTVAMLALGACSDPTARTDLRPEGPPDVLAVLVLNDAAGGLIESATYCRPGDEKRPSLVGLPDFTTQQICPDAVADTVSALTDAAPELWYVRIMFDELLDPSIEDLIPVLDANNQETDVFTGTLRNTKPVTLECQDVNNTFRPVDYDGYYSPSGNNVTWPLGPSIVIKPNDPTIIPVESECRITLKENLKDKSGEAVPESQRGPFTFKIAPVQVIAISPSPETTVQPEFGGVDLTFNVEVDATPLTTSTFAFTPAVASAKVVQYGASSVFVYGAVLDDTDYKFAVTPGTKIPDKCGRDSALAGGNLETEFATAPLDLVNIIPFQGPNAIPSRKIRINFNGTMDVASLDATDYEWVTEAPEGFNFGYLTGSGPRVIGADQTVIVANGQYKLNQNYKFKLKAGAKIKDCPSRPSTADCSTSTKELTITDEQLIDITIAPTIQNTGINLRIGDNGATAPRGGTATVAVSGAGGQTVHKENANDIVIVQFVFNQDLDGTTLTPDEFSLTKADGSLTGIPAATAGRGTAATTSVILGDLAPGSYKFTLKKGATIDDRTTTADAYVRAEADGDRVFNFNVVVDPPSPAFKCLGQ